jgi:GntR family transcriptional regulator, transcriptional repressor for pyruvate dehydrogenase complex
MTPRGRPISREELVAVFENQIIDRSLPPGSMLPSERKLSEQFSVSRSGVREVLRVLDERRLIHVEQGRGAFVREPDPAAAAAAVTDALRREQVTARDVIVGRRVLECETAALAATARTDDDLRAMGNALGQLTEHKAILERVKADLGFHLAVAHASHNPVLETMFRAITGLTAELMLRSLSDREVSRAGLPQHKDILEAIRNRDPEAARSLMRDHLGVAMDHYGPDLDQLLDIVAERQLSRMVGGTQTLRDVFDLASAASIATRTPQD